MASNQFLRNLAFLSTSSSSFTPPLGRKPDDNDSGKRKKNYDENMDSDEGGDESDLFGDDITQSN